MNRADHIFFVADGELFQNTQTRQSAKQNLIKLIGRANQVGMVSREKGINLIITKWDKLNTNNNVSDIDSFLVEPLKSRFPNLIKNVLKVASRSMTSDIKSGTGLDEFLNLCTYKTIVGYSANYIPVDEPMREFQRFKYCR
jgi:hypothetical protein